MCGKCSISKPFVEFNSDSRRPDGLFPYCKTCRRELRQTRYHEDKDYSHARAVRKTYGLSAKEYQAMYESQNGRCAICGTHASQTTGKGQRLQVDHDHATGKVGDLPCASRNTGLGNFKEDTAYLTRALQYPSRCEEAKTPQKSRASDTCS